MAKSEKVKKPLWKRWWVWVLGIIIIVSVASGGEEENAETSSKSKSSEVSVKPAEKKKEEPAQEFGLNQEVKVENFAYTVTAVEEKKELTAQYLDPIVSDSGKFVVMNVTFKNYDKKARLLDTELFKLTTPDGTEYSANTEADFQLNSDNTMFLEEVNPNATRTGKIAFEVPADANAYTLQVSSGLGWSGGQYAAIKLK